MQGVVTVRAVRLPADHDFLLSLYAATRTAELSAAGWSRARARAFIRMQFEAQTRHYDAFFPRASRSLIAVDGEPAGRLTVERSRAEIRIVEIALLPEFRGAGVGSLLVGHLLEEADATGLPVRCHVAHGNGARAFWESLGLAAQGSDGIHVAMERGCATSPR